MGTTIIAKGADFSASNVGNVFYPFWPDLIAARFWGTKITGGAALKKSSDVGPVTAHVDLGAMILADYSVTPRAGGQQFDTGLAVPATCTIVLLRSIFGNQNTGYARTQGTEPLAGTGAQAGNYSCGDYAYGQVLSQAIIYTAAKALNVGYGGVDTTTELPVLSFLTIDSNAKTASYEIWGAGQVSRDSTTLPGGGITPRNLLLENNFAAGAGVRFHHAAVLGRALSQAERITARDWLRKFYANRGLNVG